MLRIIRATPRPKYLRDIAEKYLGDMQFGNSYNFLHDIWVALANLHPGWALSFQGSLLLSRGGYHSNQWFLELLYGTNLITHLWRKSHNFNDN